MGTVWFPSQGLLVNQSVSIGERLRGERDRLGMTQPAFGAVGGVTKKTQGLYEAGDRSPGADYLAAVSKLGVDIRYVVTGEREGPPPVTLTADEQTLLSYWRDASVAVRRAAMAALATGVADSGQLQSARNVTQHFGNASIGGDVVSGDMVKNYSRSRKGGGG